MVGLAVDGIERHVFEHIVHPAHVPLEHEAEAAVKVGPGDQREGRGLLGDHERLLAHGECRLVELAQKVDRLKVLPAAIAVGPVVRAVVVEVEHGGHRVHPQAVDMVFFQPEHGVGDQEGLHLGLAVVVDAGGPVGMLVHHGVGQLVAAGAVKLIQTVLVLREVGGHPVEDDADVRLMAAVDELHELLRLAVAGRGRVVAGDLIAPAGVVGVLGDGHELDVGVAHFLYVGDQLVGQLAVAVEGAVRLALPGAEVHLIDVDRALQHVAPRLAGEVEAVVPLVAVELVDAARGLGQAAGLHAVGVGLPHAAAVAVVDENFVSSAWLGVNREGLPHALGDAVHGQIARVPEVEVANHGDIVGIGRPDAEHVAFYAVAGLLVAAQQLIRANEVAAVEGLHHIPDLLIHTHSSVLFWRLLQLYKYAPRLFGVVYQFPTILL